jgi:hypothetical protein
MNQLTESYLANLIKDLHNAENELFAPQNNHANPLMQDDKLIKLKQLKAKQISNLKYNAQKLKELLEKIDYQIKNPKIKPVGI